MKALPESVLEEIARRLADAFAPEASYLFASLR
jgi:hypothetical protein